MPDFGRYYVEPPADASEIEVEFHTQVAPSGEAGLFVAGTDLWPNRVRQDTADRVLRDGEVATIMVPRPPDRWPAAYFILVRVRNQEARWKARWWREFAVTEAVTGRRRRWERWRAGLWCRAPGRW